MKGKTPKITVTTQSYFEYVFYYMGWAFLLLTIPLAIMLWYLGIIALLLGIVLVSTVYRLTIDTTAKQIEDYLFFLGMKLNYTLIPYENIRHISIKSETYTQQLNYKSISSTIRGKMYAAYLLADEQNHFLGESKNRKSISDKGRSIAKKLDLAFIDL